MQDSRVGADGMSWRNKRKMMVTESKETKTSSHSGMMKHKSCRVVTACEAARKGPGNEGTSKRGEITV